jgi:hypothetical protein
VGALGNRDEVRLIDGAIGRAADGGEVIVRRSSEVGAPVLGGATAALMRVAARPAVAAAIGTLARGGRLIVVESARRAPVEGAESNDPLGVGVVVTSALTRAGRCTSVLLAVAAPTLGRSADCTRIGREGRSALGVAVLARWARATAVAGALTTSAGAPLAPTLVGAPERIDLNWRCDIAIGNLVPSAHSTIEGRPPQAADLCAGRGTRGSSMRARSLVVRSSQVRV